MFHLDLYTVATHSDVLAHVRGEVNTDRVFSSWAVDAFAYVVARLCERMPKPRASALRKSVMQGWDQMHVTMFDRGYEEAKVRDERQFEEERLRREREGMQAVIQPRSEGAQGTPPQAPSALATPRRPQETSASEPSSLAMPLEKKPLQAPARPPD